MVELICFKLSGRFGHFRRAESAASSLSYPVPPRTVLLGVIGAILGIEKDMPQAVLEPARIAVAGQIPLIHWHKAKLRKDPPEALSYCVKNTQSPERNTKPERATLIPQEWLLNPSYIVWVSIPNPYQTEFAERIQNRRWHFQPCLGLSEMLADVTFLESVVAKELPFGLHEVDSVVSQEMCKIDVEQVLERLLAINLLRMPRQVTPDRVFAHASYVIERQGKGIPVETAEAYQASEKVIMFL